MNVSKNQEILKIIADVYDQRNYDIRDITFKVHCNECHADFLVYYNSNGSIDGECFCSTQDNKKFW